MFDFVPNTLALVLTTILPLYASHKAITTASPALLIPWLTYYAIASLIPVAESLCPILPYLPFYAWIRLGVFAYLLLPGERQGASYVYNTYMRPFLVQHERQIEDGFATAHDRAMQLGWGYIKQAVEFIRRNVLGLSPSPVNETSQTMVAPPAHNTYMSSLLARFSLPSASIGNQTSNEARNHVYDILTTAFSQASGSVSRFAVPADTAKSPDERLRHIHAQREQLTILLGEYEAEESRLKGVSYSATNVPMKKSKSETEFDRIERDELVDSKGLANRENASSSQRWGEWLWPRNNSQMSNKNHDRSKVQDNQTITTGVEIR